MLFARCFPNVFANKYISIYKDQLNLEQVRGACCLGLDLPLNQKKT